MKNKEPPDVLVFDKQPRRVKEKNLYELLNYAFKVKDEYLYQRVLTRLYELFVEQH